MQHSSNMLVPVVDWGITFNEVPDKVAVYFELGDCNKHCKGCHSPELWEPMQFVSLAARIAILFLVTRWCSFYGCWQRLPLCACMLVLTTLKRCRSWQNRESAHGSKQVATRKN